MKDLFKSRYVLLLVTGILVLTVLMTFSFLYLTGKTGKECDLGKLAGHGAVEVVKSGQYRELYILDGEKGLFLGQNRGKNKGWALIDKKGKEVKSIDFKGYFEKKNSNMALLRHGRESLIIFSEDYGDKDDIRLIHCEYGDIDKEGTFYMVLDKTQKKYEIFNEKGKLCYTLPESQGTEDYPVEFTGKEGFVQGIEKDHAIVISLESGKTVYTLHGTDSMKDYVCGKWVISKRERSGAHTEEFAYLNDNFEPEFNGSTTSQLTGNDHILAVNTYGKDSGIALRDGFYKIPDNTGFNVCGAASDSIAVTGENEDTDKKYMYLSVENGEVTRLLESDYLSYREFEDGYSAATEKEEQTLEKDLFMNRTDIKWGFVDRNMKPATEFVFNAVSESENGYAVVAKGRQIGVIKLEGGR